MKNHRLCLIALSLLGIVIMLQFGVIFNHEAIFAQTIPTPTSTDAINRVSTSTPTSTHTPTPICYQAEPGLHSQFLVQYYKLRFSVKFYATEKIYTMDEIAKLLPGPDDADKGSHNWIGVGFIDPSYSYPGNLAVSKNGEISWAWRGESSGERSGFELLYGRNYLPFMQEIVVTTEELNFGKEHKTQRFVLWHDGDGNLRMLEFAPDAPPSTDGAS